MHNSDVKFVQHCAQGFSYSEAESVFIVQKKNHLQLSCRVTGRAVNEPSRSFTVSLLRPPLFTHNLKTLC